MIRKQPKGDTASIPTKATSIQQRTQENLNQETNHISHVANNYDLEYTQLCHILQHVVNSVEYITRHRSTNLLAIRDDIEKLVNAVDTERRSATNGSALETHRRDVHRLEREKEQLVTEISAGNKEEQKLRSKLHRVQQQMAATREECDAVKGQGASEVPSLEYISRVLHRLSKVHLTSKADSSITEGFVSQKGTNDVRPFRFDESTSHFDQVNNLWEMITNGCC